MSGKSLVYLLFMLLALSSCIPNKDDLPNPTYKYEFCHIDSLGQVIFMPEKDVYRWNSEYEMLKDGRILISGDSLLIYDPPIGSMINVTPPNWTKLTQFITRDLSPDGNWLYYGNGSIYKMNLQTYATQEIYAESGKKFMRPAVSKDGRYLTFLAVPEGQNSTGGYPVWMDLENGNVTPLPSGNSNIDRAIMYAWVDISGNQIYYEANYALMRMDMDGTNRSLVLENLIAPTQSFDGRMLLCRLSSGSYPDTYIIYRDNESMIWRDLGIVGRYALCRGSNVLYYTSDTKLFRLDMISGVVEKLVSDSVAGRQITGIIRIAPGWEGNDSYVLVQYIILEKMQGKYPFSP